MDHRSPVAASRQENHVFEFCGTHLPAAIHGMVSRRELAAHELALFSIIQRYSKGSRGCFATNNYLAASCNVTRLTVIRSVKKLVRLGIVTTEVTGRNKRTIRINPQVFVLGPDERPDDDARSISGDTRGSISGDTPCEEKRSQKLITSRVPVSTPARPPKTTDPHPDGSGRLPPAEEDTPVLIDMGTPAITKPSDPIPSDVEQASRLHSIISTHAQLSAPWSRRGWADHIRKLRGSLGGDAARIERVLEFLSAHYRDRYCPKPSCAAKLREKFAAIEACLERTPKPVTINPATTKLAAKLAAEVDWPAGAAANLEEAIQRSFDNLDKVLDKVEERRKELKPFAARELNKHAERHQYNYLRHLQADLLHGRDQVIFDWFLKVYRKLARCSDWTGSFERWIWSLSHADVAKQFATDARRYGDEGQWPDLLKLVEGD